MYVETPSVTASMQDVGTHVLSPNNARGTNQYQYSGPSHTPFRWTQFAPPPNGCVCVLALAKERESVCVCGQVLGGQRYHCRLTVSESRLETH